MSWLDQIARAVGEHGIAVRVSVIAAEGSTPREAGAAMLVTRVGIVDTIGGGALEHAAIAAAYRLMDAHPGPWTREVLSLPLGPSLGQCCGGHVKLLLEVFTSQECAALTQAASGALGGVALALRPTATGRPIELAEHRKAAGDWPLGVVRQVREMLSGQVATGPVLLRERRGAAAWYIEPLRQPSIPLMLYGAGHVGRALVRALEGLPFAVTWIDTAPSRFPTGPPAGVSIVASEDPAGLAETAPPDACHLVMTYSHPLDLAICHKVLARGAFAYLGLIGSATKRARFLKRLSEAGHPPAALARLHCPVGLPGLAGKAPAAIAVSVAADLLQRASAQMESGALRDTVGDRLLWQA